MSRPSRAAGPAAKTLAGRAARRLGLLAAGVALAFGAGELGLRALGYGTHVALYYDPAIGYRFLPHQRGPMLGPGGARLATMTINGRGHRGPTFRDGTDAFRVACLGDSFTFGWGVEDHEPYPVRLSQKIATRGPENVEVVNFGMPGYNTADELRTYCALVRPEHPDLVIVGFFLNDVAPTQRGRSFGTGPLARAVGRTALMKTFKSLVVPRFPSWFPPVEDERERPRLEIWRKNAERIQHDPSLPVAAPFWERALDELEELVHEVQSDGARCLVVCFPSSKQVRSLAEARRLELPDPETLVLNAARPQAALREVVERAGVPYLDLLPALLHAESWPFGTLDASHPNALGQELVADEVFAALESGGLLARRRSTGR